MRHRVVGKRLGRNCAHRKALLRNLSDALIMHGSIETTLAKAKYLRPYVERLVTKAKSDSSFSSVRQVNRKLVTKAASKKLFSEIAPRFVKRSGGYTRVVKLGNRVGDNAPMARLEFVEK
jgi:large subunit ribosomal protein L17